MLITISLALIIVHFHSLMVIICYKSIKLLSESVDSGFLLLSYVIVVMVKLSIFEIQSSR